MITYDQFGTGRSDGSVPEGYAISDMAAEVAAMLDDLGVTTCHFIGHALGGLIGLQLAVDRPALRAIAPHLTWIGHASFVQRLGGKLLATDPVWAERMGTRRRLTPAGVAIADLPPLDIVTVSHSHYDHLDLPTLRALQDRATGEGREPPLHVVPRNVGPLLTGAGLARVVELDWWQMHVEGALRITLVPAQHWSMRVPWDRNKRLCGGFV